VIALTSETTDGRGKDSSFLRPSVCAVGASLRKQIEMFHPHYPSSDSLYHGRQAASNQHGRVVDAGAVVPGTSRRTDRRVIMSRTRRSPVPPPRPKTATPPELRTRLWSGLSPPRRQEVLMVLSQVIAHSLPPSTRKEASHEHS